VTDNPKPDWRCDCGELLDGGLEVFSMLISELWLPTSDFIGAVFKAWTARPLLHPRYGVFEPEDVEVTLSLTEMPGQMSKN
jgi:hypothetical protein